MRAPAALSALALAGCTLINAPGDHTGGRVPVDDFCDEFADLFCEGYFGCCEAPATDPETCLSGARTFCESSLGALAIDSRTGYDEQVAAQVLYEGRQLVAACSDAIAEWYVRRDGLLRVLGGTVAGGEPCLQQRTDDIAPFFSCIERDQACLYSEGAMELQCSARRDQGGQCVFDFDCRDGLFCRRPSMGFGTCEPRLGEGASCSNHGDCASLVCARGTCVVRNQQSVYCGVR